MLCNEKKLQNCKAKSPAPNNDNVDWPDMLGVNRKCRPFYEAEVGLKRSRLAPQGQLGGPQDSFRRRYAQEPGVCSRSSVLDIYREQGWQRPPERPGCHWGRSWPGLSPQGEPANNTASNRGKKQDQKHDLGQRWQKKQKKVTILKIQFPGIFWNGSLPISMRVPGQRNSLQETRIRLRGIAGQNMPWKTKVKSAGKTPAVDVFVIRPWSW